MRKYKDLSKEEKLRLLHAKLLVRNTEKVTIEQLERDLDMLNSEGKPIIYGVPELFQENDYVMFRYDSYTTNSLEMDQIISSISEYCPNLNIIFVGRYLPFNTHLMAETDYQQLVEIVNKYFYIEKEEEEDDEEPDRSWDWDEEIDVEDMDDPDDDEE